ncbi:hypothetical protein BDQ12DRAFT_76517 [Crucibulum laeve]|uniref:Uncharacterized protein n=1 Tax=Crucibulum laeve TaxID=68775 RepID=A0A5C3MDV0_9AGAR|nr:hypothetical protein BDQ12DRAFT_76517 [Crucibulum laeve]
MRTGHLYERVRRPESWPHSTTSKGKSKSSVREPSEPIHEPSEKLDEAAGPSDPYRRMSNHAPYNAEKDSSDKPTGSNDEEEINTDMGPGAPSPRPARSLRTTIRTTPIVFREPIVASEPPLNDSQPSGGTSTGFQVKWDSERKRRQGYFAPPSRSDKSPFRHYNKSEFE